jgi:hypothetical protein
VSSRAQRGIFSATGILLVAVAVLVSASVRGQPTKPPTWQQRLTPPVQAVDTLIVIANDPCCEKFTQIPLMPSSDAQEIERHRDRAFRSGPILQLKLEGNRSIRFIDPSPISSKEFNCLEWETCVYYSLVGWWQEQGYYVVNVLRNESRITLLVSETDGQNTYVFAPPIRSPSGRYAIAYDSVVMTGGHLDLVDLSVRPPLVLKIESAPNCEGAQSSGWLHPKPVWIDDSHVKFERIEGISLPMENPNAEQLMQIVDGKIEWKC